MFTIGTLAEKTRLSPDTLRYYEKEKLLEPVDRSESGYRLYDAETLRRVRFIRQAQDCGFRLAEIREFLDLSREGTGFSGEVRRKVFEKKRHLEQRIRAMQGMVRTLDRLGNLCCEVNRPIGDCPILAAFQEETLSEESIEQDHA